MWLPRNDNVLLWVCGCTAAKGTYAEKTFSPEKITEMKNLRCVWAAGCRSWRGILWITEQKPIVKQIFGLWLRAEARPAELWIQQAECHPGKNIRGGRRTQILHWSKSLLTTMWKYFEFLEENISFHFDTSWLFLIWRQLFVHRLFYNFIYKTFVIYLETCSEVQPYSFITHIPLLYLCVLIVKEHKTVLQKHFESL